MAGTQSHVLPLTMHHLILATSNLNKAKEIQSVLPDGFHVLTMKEAGIDIEIPEPFHTLEENSRHKAQTIYLATGEACFAEDTGLEVQALNGAPGVISARYSGEPRDDKRNIQKLLHELNGIENRSAQFRTVMTLFLDGKPHEFEGICKGQIVHEPKGTEGFGYDPVFIPDGSNHTFAEMGLQEKNIFSHRKKALVQMIDFLTTITTD
jgi:XTP/dITP diphosphohydrolase